jgi:hypothetical protein
MRGREMPVKMPLALGSLMGVFTGILTAFLVQGCDVQQKNVLASGRFRFLACCEKDAPSHAEHLTFGLRCATEVSAAGFYSIHPESQLRVLLRVESTMPLAWDPRLLPALK